MKSLSFIISLITGILLSACSNPYTKELVTEEPFQGPILITQANIFNGKDSTLIMNKDVLLEGGLIKKIGENLERKKAYQIIDGEGKTLIPGLIDAHVHLSGSGAVPWENVRANEEYNLKSYLYAGITTVYDLGGLAGDMEKLAKKVEEEEIMGPSIFHTHIPITVKNGHPIPLTEQMLPWPLKTMVNSISPTIEKTEDAKELIDDYTKKEIDYVKIICDQIPPGSPEMPFESLKALIEAAHKKGYKTFVHIGSPENAVDAARAGADVLAHGIWRGKLTAEQADLIAEKNIPIIYTLAAFHHVDEMNRGAYTPSELEKELIPAKILNPVTSKNGLDVKKQAVMNEFFEDVSSKKEYWKANFDLLKERGVKMILGTDSSLPGTYAGASYFNEIDALKSYGLSNFEILTGATYLPSKLFLSEPDFGEIAEGKKANLLLLYDNPLEVIDALKEPELIMVGGKIVKRVN